MLVKLLPDQAAKNWPLIRKAVATARPEYVDCTEGELNYVLAAIVSGEMQVWVSVTPKDEEHKINGLVITTIVYDKFTQIRNLLIYSVVSYAESDNSKSWDEGLITMNVFAKANGCSNIVGYVHDQNIVNVCERLGAKLSTFITIKV